MAIILVEHLQHGEENTDWRQDTQASTAEFRFAFHFRYTHTHSPILCPYPLLYTSPLATTDRFPCVPIPQQNGQLITCTTLARTFFLLVDFKYFL